MIVSDCDCDKSFAESPGSLGASLHIVHAVMRERILRPNHKDLVYWLMFRGGAEFADAHRYQAPGSVWTMRTILVSRVLKACFSEIGFNCY